MDKITKEQFDIAYNNHLPSGWVKFAFKHFSKETGKQNKGLSKTITTLFLILFAIGFISVAFNLPESIVKYSTFIYCFILPLIVAYLSIAAIANNIRIKKIIKELGVSEDEYNSLVAMYG